jgi:hypothetical protein
MARQINDGRGRIGGRQKGTPNKTTLAFKEWINKLLETNRKQIVKDLESIEPKERLQFFEKLIPYVVPRLTSIDAEIGSEKFIKIPDGMTKNGVLKLIEDHRSQMKMSEEEMLSEIKRLGYGIEIGSRANIDMSTLTDEQLIALSDIKILP